MSMLCEFKNKDDSNYFKNKGAEILNLGTLSYDEDGCCNVKFLPNNMFIKKLVVPIITNNSFTKKERTDNNVSYDSNNCYIDQKTLLINYDELSNDEYYKNVSFDNVCFKRATINYLKSMYDSDLNNVANIFEKYNNNISFLKDFWFVKDSTPNFIYKMKILKEKCPELYDLFKKIFDKDGNVYFYTNVIPNYKANSYNDQKYQNLQGKEKEYTEVETDYTDSAKNYFTEKTKIHFIDRSDDITKDLERTPVRIIMFKKYHFSTLQNTWRVGLKDVDSSQNKKYGLDTDTNSFIVKIVNQPDRKKSFSLCRQVVDLDIYEKNLLRWDIRELLHNHSKEQIESDLNSWGYRDDVSVQVTNTIINDKNIVDNDIAYSSTEITGDTPFGNETEEEWI